ncbi:MAG: hypothetical protein EOP86_00070 [Verrucomicrobiaceae bacterium]|nr:MAG: hypothetical protein EOP86_00070 [Verrucomicrobiaceae bacterium]
MGSSSYDIVSLVETSGTPGELLFSIWEKLSPAFCTELVDEEKVILDAWNFDSTFGNGINDLLVNENYDVIANGFRAMRVLAVPRLLEFTEVMESIFGLFGINCASGDDLAKLEQLTSSQRERLEAGLASAELPFLNDFWHAGVLMFAAKDYLMKNLEAFKIRKKED